MDRPLTSPLSCPQSVITASLTYSSDCIKALCVQPLYIPRATRKILFLYGIWRPRTGHPSLERRLADPPPAQETASTLLSVPAAASPINGLRLATWNIHSLRHKYIAVADTILSEGLDLLMVTESWLRLMWRFVDLRRLATPMWTAQERAPRMKIIILVGLSSTIGLR